MVGRGCAWMHECRPLSAIHGLRDTRTSLCNAEYTDVRNQNLQSKFRKYSMERRRRSWSESGQDIEGGSGVRAAPNLQK